MKTTIPTAVVFLVGFLFISLTSDSSDVEMMKACADDLNNFCQEIKQGPEQPLCLKEHARALSPDCRKAVKSMRTPPQGGKGRMKACAEDVKKFCQDIAQGPERPQCLKEHASDLSPDCRKALNSMGTPQ